MQLHALTESLHVGVVVPTLYTYVRHRLPQEQQHFPSTKHLISSRLKSFLNYMDEKKQFENAKETSQESDENLPEAPNFGTNISTPPVWESPVSVNTGGHIELSGYEDTSGHIEGGGGYIEDTGGHIEGEGGGGVTTGGDPIEEDDDYEGGSGVTTGGGPIEGEGGSGVTTGGGPIEGEGGGGVTTGGGPIEGGGGVRRRRL